MTYQEFHQKVHDYYNTAHPWSIKPRPSVISRWYDDHLKGRDFIFAKGVANNLSTGKSEN